MFAIEKDNSKSDQTVLAGAAIYFEILKSIGFYKKFKNCFKKFHPGQGWDAFTIVLVIIFLNILGHDHVSDINILIADAGFVTMFREYLKHEMTSIEWAIWENRFNERCNNMLPCATVIMDFLNMFNDPKMVGVKGTATIHKASDNLLELEKMLKSVSNISYQKSGSPKTVTLDQDATIVPTFKQKALYTYLMDKGYQPVNVYCYETDSIIHTEFRDGNVPAKMNLMEMLTTAINKLPDSVKKIRYRGDSASFNYGFIKAMASGDLDPKKRIISFAVSALSTSNIKSLYAGISESSWKPYNKKYGLEYAEVSYYEEWMGTLKPLRLLVLRSEQKNPKKIKNKPRIKKTWDANQIEIEFDIEGVETEVTSITSGNKTYEFRSIVSNIPESVYSAKKLIKWARKRAGKPEELHAVQKNDLSGGCMPSGKFAVNWAWWLLTCIAFNIQSLLKRVGLPKEYKKSRFKRIRSTIIYCAAKVSRASRRVTVRIQNAVQLALITEIIVNIRLSFDSS
jgi:hypothetical protein